METNGDKQTESRIQLPKSADSEYVAPERHEKAFTSIGGRPNKITAEIIQSIYDNVRIGMPKDKAAPLAGISEATYHNWMKSAREIWKAIQEANTEDNAINIELSELDILYLELLEAVALAESELIREATQVILAEGPAGYKWILGRLQRSIYGDKMDVGIQTEPVQLTLELPNMIQPHAENEPKRIDTPNREKA